MMRIMEEQGWAEPNNHYNAILINAGHAMLCPVYKVFLICSADFFIFYAGALFAGWSLFQLL